MKRFPVIMVLIGAFISARALAAPSIGDLDKPQEVYIVIEHENEVEEINSIYTDPALEEQYDTHDAELIKLGKKTITDTGNNGHMLIDEIPSVTSIVSFFDGTYDTALLRGLKQLIYIQDFKYTSTHYRVIEDNEYSNGGRIRATIKGGEITKESRIEDFVIIQFNLKTREVFLLQMVDYDAKTGDYTVDFPCFGPYILTLRMDE